MRIKSIANRRSSALAKLFEQDETAWLERMAKLSRQHLSSELDLDNLAEYLHDMTVSHRREVMSRLATLLAHLLKWDHQPRKRSGSWEATILSQRDELSDLLESKTLRRYANSALEQAYARAVRRATKETDLPKETFPDQCPYSLEDVLAEE